MKGCRSNHLSQYDSLIHWAVNASRLDDESTVPERKDALLADLNGRLNTSYRRNHIDNWLAGRKGTPKRVRDLLASDLIEVELQDLESNIRRLVEIA